MQRAAPADYEPGWDAAGRPQALNPGVTDEAVLVSRTLLIHNVPIYCSHQQLLAFFERFGEVRRISLYSQQRTAYVDFWDIRASEQSRNFLDATGLILEEGVAPPSDLYVAFSKVHEGRPNEPTGTLFVRPRDRGNPTVDPNSNEAYQELFESYGQIKGLTTNRKRSSERFVEYFDIRAATNALRLNNFSFNGVVLDVQMSRSQSKTYNTNSSLLGSSPSKPIVPAALPQRTRRSAKKIETKGSGPMVRGVNGSTEGLNDPFARPPGEPPANYSPLKRVDLQFPTGVV